MSELNITQSALYNEMVELCGKEETHKDAWTKEHFMELWGLRERSTKDRIKKMVAAGKIHQVQMLRNNHSCIGYYPVKTGGKK